MDIRQLLQIIVKAKDKAAVDCIAQRKAKVPNFMAAENDSGKCLAYAHIETIIREEFPEVTEEEDDSQSV